MRPKSTAASAFPDRSTLEREVHFRQKFTVRAFAVLGLAPLIAVSPIEMTAAWLFAAFCFCFGVLELVYIRRNPLITVAPWSLVLRPGILGRQREFTSFEVIGWSIHDNLLGVLIRNETRHFLPLSLLGDDERQYLADALSRFGYPSAEAEQLTDDHFQRYRRNNFVKSLVFLAVGWVAYLCLSSWFGG